MLILLLHTFLLKAARSAGLLLILLLSFRPNLPAQPAAPPTTDPAPELRGGRPARTGIASPLPIPLVLAGNFGELRPDHFHTGLDFKTQGREGIPVLAATDGVVERIKVSPYGYGQALYLRSPDGITTVYAHLQKFYGPLATWVLEEQYRQKSNAIDVSPRRAFSFSQGDTLAFSGNTGGSFGPHLHFEVRDGATQRPVNPLLWELPVADGTPPEIGALWVLPVDGAEVNGSQTPTKVLPGHGPVRVAGAVRLALDALDRLDGAGNVCGPFGLSLEIDNEEIFRTTLDTLDFSLQRDMNAHALYDVYSRQRSQTHRLHRLPGNRLPIYRGSHISGYIPCVPGDTLHVRLTATDVHGNESQASFTLLGITASHPAPPGDLPEHAFFLRHDAPMQWRAPAGPTIFVPAGTFYEDHEFPVVAGRRDHLYTIGDPGQPAAQRFTVHFPAPDTAGRWFAARLDERGDVDGTYALKRSGDQLVLETKTTGTFALRRDDTPPVLKLQGGPADWARWGEVRWTFADAGVGPDGEVDGFIDGQWVRLAWDPRVERLTYDLGDKRHATGTAQAWRIAARDELGNTTEWAATLTARDGQ
jgi:hypothetical protein